MKMLTLVLVCVLSVIQVYGQLTINEPIPYKDSLNINRIVTYEVSNFISTDTSITIFELDQYARIRKKSKYLKGTVYSDQEYFALDESNLFYKSIKLQEEDLDLKIPSKIFTFYEYDLNNNLILETSKTETDSIIQQTKFNYNPDNTINEIIYSIVPYRFEMSKPNETIDTFEYDIKENIIKRIRKYPNGSRKLKNEDQIEKQRHDLTNIENDTLEFNNQTDRQRTRTVFTFDEKKNIIRQEGYMRLKDKKGNFGDESKVFTIINKIEYKEP